jgi:invasion protein IalB
LAGSQVQAAQISTIPIRNDPDRAIIFVEGDLNAEDIEAFRSKIAPFSRGTIVFSSNGGLVRTGIEIGRIIRLRDFQTLVEGGKRCASACAIAWLGGTSRKMGKGALVGFHAAYIIDEQGKKSENGLGNALIGGYLSQIGLSDRAIAYITQTPPNSMAWLTPSDARLNGINVIVYDPESPASAALPGSTPSQPILPKVSAVPQPATTPPTHITAPDRDKQPQLIFSPWVKLCNRNPSATRICVTVKDGRVESGLLVVSAAIIEKDGEQKKLRISMPYGVAVQHGTRLIIDQGRPATSPFATCLPPKVPPGGCIADYEASVDMINEMKKGQVLTVQAIHMNGQAMSPQLDLRDFAKAYDGPPTDPRAFEEEQKKKLREELQRRAAAKK